jgi:hypothetical protein
VPGLDDYALSHGWRILNPAPGTDLETVANAGAVAWAGSLGGSAGTIGVGNTVLRNVYAGSIAGP